MGSAYIDKYQSNDLKFKKNYSLAKRNWLYFLISEKTIYFWGIFFVILTAFLQVLSTRIMGWVVDFFTEVPLPPFLKTENLESQFNVIFFILVGSRLGLFLSRIGWRWTLARQTHKASSKLKIDLWDSVRYFHQKDLIRKFTKGILMNANTSDVSSGRFIYGFTLVAIFDMVFLGIFTLSMMVSINLKLSLISIGVLIFLPYFVKKLSTLEMERYKASQESLGDFNDLISQVVSTIRLQRVNQTGSFWIEKMEKSAEGYRKKKLSAVYTSLKYIPVMGTGHLLSYATLFFAGIPFVINKQISIGDFVSMQGLIFLIQDPLAEMGYIISEWKKSFTSLGRLSEIYEHPKDSTITNPGEAVKENSCFLRVRDLSYQYADGDKEVLCDISFDLEKGQRLGVKGTIGSGKTTLIKILGGLVRDFSGDILFYGKPFNFYSHKSLRDHIGIVPQRPFLFADNIRENVRLNKNLSDEEVWFYLKLACLDEDIRNFQDQLDTPLGEWGINLSGGQKQRLTLARALARGCEFYLFDDCLSAVDTVTEEKILNNLNQYLKHQTLVWVAHRKSTLKYCHNILELK